MLRCPTGNTSTRAIGEFPVSRAPVPAQRAGAEEPAPILRAERTLRPRNAARPVRAKRAAPPLHTRGRLGSSVLTPLAPWPTPNGCAIRQALALPPVEAQQPRLHGVLAALRLLPEPHAKDANAAAAVRLAERQPKPFRSHPRRAIDAPRAIAAREGWASTSPSSTITHAFALRRWDRNSPPTIA